MTYETMGVDYSFFVEKAASLHKNKIPEELLQEMKGMVEGLKIAKVEATLDDIIGWNSYEELTNNWFTKKKAISRCSSFIATGSTTKDKKIILGHNTFDDFWNAPFDNIILHLVATKGNSFLMQTQPLYLSSM